VTRPGGFAEYVLAPKANIYPIGALPYAEAAFIRPLSCVAYGLRRLQLPVGANALIYGAGTIGLLMLQLVKKGGAGQVVSVDAKPEKLDVARRLGASAVVLAGERADATLREISGLGYDVVIDCTGVPGVVEHLFAHVRDEGTLLFFGVNPTEAMIKVSPYDVYKKDLTILGSFALRYTFHQAIALLGSGSVEVGPLLAARLPIDRFSEALALSGTGDVLKVQIQPQG